MSKLGLNNYSHSSGFPTLVHIHRYPLLSHDILTHYFTICDILCPAICYFVSLKAGGGFVLHVDLAVHPPLPLSLLGSQIWAAALSWCASVQESFLGQVRFQTLFCAKISKQSVLHWRDRAFIRRESRVTSSGTPFFYYLCWDFNQDPCAAYLPRHLTLPFVLAEVLVFYAIFL